jgi:dihydrofolate reductase
MAGNRARRVIAQQWVSVDGFAAGPTDETEIFAAVDDMSGSEEYNRRLLEHVDEVLLGRRSYESFVGFWPRAEGEPMAEAVNAIPKVVCSTTLREAPWGAFDPARVVPDAVAHVRERRREPGGDLLIWGSLALMRSLLEAGEVDELDLFVAPIALGAGTPLVAQGGPYRLQQIDVEVWPSAVHLRYSVRRAQPSETLPDR